MRRVSVYDVKIFFAFQCTNNATLYLQVNFYENTHVKQFEYVSTLQSNRVLVTLRVCVCMHTLCITITNKHQQCVTWNFV